jgi:hypothetical protein
VIKTLLQVLVIFSLLAGCSFPISESLTVAQSENNEQYKDFSTTDSSKVMRAIISVTQRLGFSVTQASEKEGLISAKKQRTQDITFSAILEPLPKETRVKLTVFYKGNLYKNSQVYGNFFKELSKQLR